MKVVIVESPAKAKTINKYLGNDYLVVASYGHVRNLPRKNGSVDTENDFNMTWQFTETGKKRFNDISSALKDAEKLILATDPDREGEAISWHITELLQKKLSKINFERVVFNEITKKAITEAIKNPRGLDIDLINAYNARLAIDYLIGFNISPVLWKRLPGANSAGRVQSVALKLICEREKEIEKFNIEEYWTISANFSNKDKTQFIGKLVQLEKKKLNKLDIKNEAQSLNAKKLVENNDWKVQSIEEKKVNRKPFAPFTTSTLQQEASRKLNFSANKTMQVAQKLYEGINIGSETTGLITYMRTDGVQISIESINSIRNKIQKEYGKDYIPEKIRFYKTKAANSQEAHEAIRPTSIDNSPQNIKKFLDHDQYRLYDLIWKRTVTSQMSDAVFNQTSVDIISSDGNNIMRSNGSVIIFEGFRKIYNESSDEKENNPNYENEMILPQLKENENLDLVNVFSDQHFTQPPARFTDASLIKKLEELGIGRPSTYASTIQTLEKRKYVYKESKRFFPENTGRILSVFLENYFEKYVQYDFTANLENQLDIISDGKLEWKKFLNDFWQDFSLTKDDALKLSITEVVETLDKELQEIFFQPDPNGKINRNCSKCSNGYLSFKLSKYGPFIGCSNYPECKYTKQISKIPDDGNENNLDDEKVIGHHPDFDENNEIYLKKGPYGFYIQLGEAIKTTKKKVTSKKPKRISVPKNINIEDIDLELAISLLSLPRNIGNHPETDSKIESNIGPYGPYLKYEGKFISLKGDDDVLTIGINRAVDLLEDARKKQGRTLGEHPDKGIVELKKGRFGAYIEYKKFRAPLPKNLEMHKITLDEAIIILEEKKLKSKNK